MPLLRKKPFQKLHLSSDYKDEDEVFHCTVTNEIFKDYNEFCERIILCNSMIWSCSITGKSGMTYEEALQCEENAKESLKDFPMELRIPVLYIANKTSRNLFSDLIEDVYQYVRERYFVGEMIEASFEEDSWCECHILQVIEPSGIEETVTPAKLYRYEVEQLDSSDTDVSQLMTVEASQIRRKKQQYSREKNKIFLRMLCEQLPTGKWVVKDDVIQKYGINKVRFDSIFVGQFPESAFRQKKVSKQKQESLDKYFTTSNLAPKITKPIEKKPQINNKPKMTAEEKKAKLLEEKRAKKEEEKLEKQERKREEKMKQSAFTAFKKSWNKLREDLQCEDLRPIPASTPVKTDLKSDQFSDVVMILEFMRFFHDELEVKTWFPNGVTLELLEQAVLKEEIAGPYSDLIHLLLANVFRCQAEEDGEINETEVEQIDFGNIDHAASCKAEAVELATKASGWSQNYQGCKTSELTLDSLTLSETLRQHFLSSGGRPSDITTKWRYSQRGGYSTNDDPALLLRIDQPHILRALGHQNLCELGTDDKLCIAVCLINQLLTFASIRDVLDERYEKVHNAKRELKMLILAEQKREKEEKEKQKEKEAKEKENNAPVPVKKVTTRSEYEDEKKKMEYEIKLRELQQILKDDRMMVFLGSDRAHRKYWRLLSIPGLFVESADPFPGECLANGSPCLPELQNRETVENCLRQKFEREMAIEGDNFFNKILSESVIYLDKELVKSPKMNATERTKFLSNLKACTGNHMCPVHHAKTEPRWSYYGDVEDIKMVIDSLNDRGVRESELKANLVSESMSLVNAIKDCPFVSSEAKDKTAKKNKYENTNLNYPADMAINDVLEFTFRDYILDLEEKISAGYLGSLKVRDRDQWRSLVSNRKYDMQCQKLTFAGNEMEVDSDFNIHIVEKKVDPDSETPPSTLKPFYDAGKYLGPVGPKEPSPSDSQLSAVTQMACALLQVSKAVDAKFMQKPLIGEQKDRWEQSLLMCSNWSQLFVHYVTLENSIVWSKSAINAVCRICRKRSEADMMLLCDNCNKGYHLFCLKPKLQSIPDGDWYCQACNRGRDNKKDKSKKRRKFEEEKTEEPTEQTKETRHIRAKKDFNENSDRVESHCARCKDKGDLLTCDTCSKGWHLHCVDPPLGRHPRGHWTCPSCKYKEENSMYARSTRRSLKRAVEEELKDTDIGSLRPTLFELLGDVKKHRDSWAFMTPVTLDEVPDYNDYISQPMDFGTIKENLEEGKYRELQEFFYDCLLVFDNCQTYNPENTNIYKCGERLQKYFKRKCSELNLNFDESSVRQAATKAKVPKFSSNLIDSD